MIGQSDACRGQSQRRLDHPADDPRLLDLAGWQERAGQRGERGHSNDQIDRSPDPELSNPREFVAVNMEYFLLDPEYACRRPALQRDKEHFDWAPTSQTPCRNGLPYMNAGRDFARQPLGVNRPATGL